MLCEARGGHRVSCVVFRDGSLFFGYDQALWALRTCWDGGFPSAVSGLVNSWSLSSAETHLLFLFIGVQSRLFDSQCVDFFELLVHSPARGRLEGWRVQSPIPLAFSQFDKAATGPNKASLSVTRLGDEKSDDVEHHREHDGTVATRGRLPAMDTLLQWLP